MREYIICNTVPVYGEAPISHELLKSQTSQVFNNLHTKQANKKYMILSKQNQEIMALLQEQDNKAEIEFILVDAIGGFVFGNDTAVEKLLDGEKPIPNGMNAQLPVYSVETILDSVEKLVYVDGSVQKKGPISFPKTEKPNVILDQCGLKGEVKGMYFGYPMGMVIGVDQLDIKLEITTDYIYVFDKMDCILDQLLKITGRYGKESCGKCVFGHEGITQINLILTDIAQKKGKSDDVELLLDLCSVMEKQALCEIGIAAAKTVLTTFQNFKEEIEEHITKKSCRAVVCEKFVTYHILPDLCTGCTDCVEECEDDAILGKKKFIHVISQDECIQCGACVSVCDEGAIVKAGAIKPKCPKKPIPCK